MIRNASSISCGISDKSQFTFSCPHSEVQRTFRSERPCVIKSHSRMTLLSLPSPPLLLCVCVYDWKLSSRKLENDQLLHGKRGDRHYPVENPTSGVGQGMRNRESLQKERGVCSVLPVQGLRERQWYAGTCQPAQEIQRLRFSNFASQLLNRATAKN